MKKLYITMIAMIFASVNCMADDVVTFEDIAVNADGYQNDFGEESAFEAGGFTFNNNYFPEWSYWSGIAVSGRTATTFTSYELDQFNSCVGEGVNGSKQFAVVYPQGETIDVNDPAGKQISGFYVTNNAWVVDAILNGDGMTPGAFTKGDFLALSIIGTHPDETTETITYYLAYYRSENEADHYYVKDWQWVDLSALGVVESITFRMESSRNNDWGMTTPGYFCMDDFNGKYNGTPSGIENNSCPHTPQQGAATEIARYTLDGRRIHAPQRGINIIRMSDGSTRKVVVK